MDNYSKFLLEKHSGKYNRCKYPNLIEIHGLLPTDYFADVTHELILAVFRGEKDLTHEEISRIANYNNIPLTVLTCPKLIMLDTARRRHLKMIKNVDMIYMRLKYMAKIERNREAQKYLELTEPEYQAFLRAVYNNSLTYGHYLAEKRRFSQYIEWSLPKPEKRSE